MKVSISKVIIGLTSVVLFSSCGGFNKILKSSDNELKYGAALKYFEKEDYNRAALLFEQLVLPFQNTERDDTVNFYYAKSYWGQGDYHSGAYELDRFCRTFGRSAFAEEGYYLRALCYYNNSYRFELDQGNTLKAISSYNEYMTRYPESDKLPAAKKYLTELEDRLETKSFYAAKLYYQIEDFQAAVVALRNSIKDYPESKYKEEEVFLILKSSYLYAKNSIVAKQKERYIATVDEYYNFAGEFPESKWTREAESMYKDAMRYIEKNKTAEDIALEEEAAAQAAQQE